MIGLRYIFLLIIFYWGCVVANAQIKSFELSNPNSIILDKSKLELLTSGYWRVFQDDLENRGEIISAKKNLSMCYYTDGTFLYNGTNGVWKILEDRFIELTLTNKSDEDRLNFGGIFAVIQLSDSRLTLTKVLTSSHDMKRTIYLKSSTILTRTEQPKTLGAYFYDGILDEQTLDSLSHLNSEELFNAGFTIWNNRIHIITPDSMYLVEVNN